MAYNRNVTGLQSTLGMIERIKDPRQLQQLARQYQQQPNGGAIIAAALVQAQKLQRLQAPQAPQGQQGPQQEPPVVNEAIASINPRELPEDSGIARLPAGNMDFAEGGIVAFSKGKTVVGDFEQQIRDEAERQGVDPDLMVRMFATESAGKPNAVSPKGAAGLGQLMIPAAKEMGLSPEERFDPSKNIPASVGYFKKQLGAFGGDPEKAAAAYNWGPGALGKHLANKPVDWKAGLPKETANYLTSLLPMGSAQAAPAAAPAPAAPQAAPTVSPADDGTVYDPMTGVPLYQGTPTPYAESPGKILKQIAAPVVKGVTKAAKFITSAPQTADDLAENTAPIEGKILSRDFADVDSPPRAAPPPELPLSEKKMIGLAKEALPASERKGWTDDMLLQFFLSMMAGKSPNALTNIGEAGLGALKYGQEAKKAEMEQRKSAQDIELGKAHTKYYGAAADRYALEDKPLAQYLKAVDTALAGLAKDDMYAMAKPAEKAAMERETRQRVLATYGQHYPELLSTMGAGGTGFKVLGSR